MKTVKNVLGKLKGEGNVNKVIAGKGSFSKAAFSDLTNALVNDTTHKVGYRARSGNNVELNISELLRADLKRTVANAKFPQKSEVDILDTVEISTNGLAEAIPYIVEQHIMTGKKFALPAQDTFSGDVYLNNVAGATKIHKVRNMATGEDDGTSTITTKDYVQVRAKSPAPKHLQTKVRKDISGKVVTA